MKGFVTFTGAQRIDPLWRRTLKPMLLARLEECRRLLERPTSTPEATASLRGNISLIRELLALEADPVHPALGDDRGSDD